MSECSFLRVRSAPLSTACFVNVRAIVLALFCLVLSLPVLRAQPSGTASVTGRISNAVTGSYLTNARVTVVGTGKTVFTNSYGEYRVTGLTAGDFTLEFFYTGLDAKSVSISLTVGQSAVQNVALSSAELVGDVNDDTVLLEEFIVQATEQAADAVAINEQRFSTNIKNVVSADAFGDVTEGNPGEFLKYLPGVSVDYVAADVRSVSVRGLGSEFTSVNVDGNRMASAASSGASRTFELEQVSMNNVARLEVVKVPVPSMPADSLGGSVNLVSKNAFERDNPEFKYRVYTSISNEDFTLSSTPGPSVERSRKIRPGFDFSYANPLSSNFGFILNGLHSDQFNEQHRSRYSWQTSGGSRASAADPYLRTYTVQDGPKETRRDSIGINTDLKLSDRSVVSFGYQWNDYDSFFGNRNYNINAGSNATDYSATHTNGRSGAGEITGGMSFRNKFGTTNHASLAYKFFGDDLEVNAGAYYSYATNKYRDIDNGHFSGVNTRVRSLTISHNNVNVDASVPPDMTIVNGSGAAVDWTDLSNYRLRSVRSQQFDSWDEFTGMNVDVTKGFDSANPFELKVGLNMRQQERDIIRRQDDYNYVGPDGRAETADDSALPFLDEVYVNQDPHFGLPSPQYADPYKVYQHFLQNPGYFEANVNNWQNRAQNDYNLTEKISAAYIQGDWSLMDGKVKFLTGARYEKTEIDGVGFLYNPDGHKDANGNVLTNDVATQRRLQYQRRAANVSRDYDGFYPSAHLVYNIKDNLILRLAYARTIGRPDFSEILPGTIIDVDETAGSGEPGGTITVRNTGLKPYTGDNFDLSLEYYFEPAGVFSVGVFHKDITDFFGGIAKFVDQSDLALYNLDPQYLGYRLSTTINSGDAKVSGFELNYNQQLVMLPGIWKNFSVFANGTFLDLEGGNNADFSGFIENTGNWGVSYGGQKFNAKIKWNYRGEQFRSFQSAYGTNGAEYYDDRLYLDVNFDYQINKRLTVFLNARNVLNEQQVLQRYGDDTPGYARNYQAEEFGVQYAVGIKGKF